MKALCLWAMAATLLLAGPAVAQPAAPQLTHVEIEGNRRVEDEAIRVHLRSRAGARFDEADVDADIRALYAMGFFDNIEADLQSVAGESVLTYRVRERPFIRELRIEGNDEIDKDELEPALRVRPNTIYTPQKVQQGIEEAKKLYAKKGYLDTTITPELKPIDGSDGEVRLTYRVDEKDVIRIEDLVFEGNSNFSARKLSGYMQTKEAWILSFFTGAGNLDDEALEADVERLTAFYYDNGYIDVRIDKPVVERKDDGLQVTIKIDEGEQYKVGKVRLAGDPLPDMSRANDALTLSEGDIFRSSKLRNDITAVTEVYGDEGYAFVNVNPDTQVDSPNKKVDVVYNVSKGPVVFIDTIDVSGNTKTRDKVIRRELELEEQQRFSGAKLRRSQERLQRLGFFSDVNITTKKSDEEDRLDMIVDVKETSTGAFSAGAGIASGENFLFNVRLSELNLFG
ncbi:MAG TPA: outer membrane protein assembly factor BamA, partial [Terriglobales bacterium]|nr:outer membrane protein assembly factor BamA [Terriglobales bacterium]